MNTLLFKITSHIQNYRNLKDKLDFSETETILDLMRKLSSDLFFLGQHLNDARDQYYECYMKHIREGKSSTESEKRAKYEVPEKRMLEDLSNRGYKVFEAMRSQQSKLKQENER